MSNTEIVKKGMKAWENNDAETLNTLVTDDFSFEGGLPSPIGKTEFLGMMQAMLTAVPDWAFNATNFQEQGNTVVTKSRITGTHKGTLVLPGGMPPIPATGKKIALPTETQTYMLENGKLKRLVVEEVPGGGIPGLLAQIGVNLPS